MNILIKSGLGVGTIAGASGLGYGIYSNLRTTPKTTSKVTSYEDLLKGTLLSFEDNQNSTEWGRRLTSLKEARNDNLIESLKAIKEKKQPQTVAAWQDLRNWCKNNIKNPNKGAENKEFLNIQNYCTFSVKEKIVDAVDESASGNDDSKWAVGHKKLQNINENELDADLISAKKQKNGAGNTAVKNWCIQAYKKPYKGENNKDYKNASRICVSK